MIRPLFITLSVLMATTTSAASLDIEHARGSTSFEAPPARTVVFDLAALDHLHALGVQVVGVAGSRFPDYLGEYADARYVKTGTLFEPDYDVVRKQSPDVILAGGRSGRAYDKLSEIAPVIELATDNHDFVPSVVRNLTTLGKLYGKPEKARELSTTLQASVRKVSEKSAGASAVTLFVINDSIMPHAPGERFGNAYGLLGLKSTLPAVPLQEGGEAAPRPAAGSPEANALKQQQAERLRQALQAEPQWLIVLDRGAATGGEATAKATLARHPQVSATRAWQAGRVFYLDPATWYLVGGGYTALTTTIASFTQALEAAGQSSNR